MNEHENPKQDIERKNALDDAKKVEYYSQGVSAWFNSRLEHDKSLFTLSVAGIGVLVSIMQTAIDSISSLLLYISAIFSFIICLSSVLIIFNRNTKHIEYVLNKQAVNDSLLGVLDRTAGFSFLIAMLFSALLGISSAITTYIEKGNKMTTENTKNTDQHATALNSINGAGKLNPAFDSVNQMSSLQKSFQGMASLQGQTTPAQGQAPQASTTTGHTQQSGASDTANKPK